MFLHTNVSHFPIYRSDYALIMLNTIMVHNWKGDKKFRFEFMCLARNDCKVVGEKAWNEHPSAESLGVLLLVPNIYLTRPELTFWNTKCEFGKLRVCKAQ